MYLNRSWYAASTSGKSLNNMFVFISRSSKSIAFALKQRDEYILKISASRGILLALSYSYIEPSAEYMLAVTRLFFAVDILEAITPGLYTLSSRLSSLIIERTRLFESTAS